MNNEEIIKKLSNEIVIRLEKEYGFSNIKVDMEKFLEQDLEMHKKEEVLEILYIFTLYKNGYISADPRVREKYIFEIKNILKISSNSSDFEEKIKKAKESLEKFEDAETHPIQTITRKIKDVEESKRMIF